MRTALLILACYFIVGCNNTAKPPTLMEDSVQPDGTELNDTATIVVPDTTHSYNAKVAPVVRTKLPSGFYRVELPCQDCPGLEHTVYFQRNKTFLMEEVQKDDPATITKTTGTFNPSSGTVWAYKGQVVIARYTWSGDSLYYLWPNGKRLAMQKLVAATDNDVWRKKGKEGLAFYGVGNEPFWSLEINRNEGLAFHQAEWTKPLQLTGATMAAAGDSVVYTATTDSTSLKAIIHNRFCSDGMSDFIYTHSLEVIYNGKRFHGCGIGY